MPKKIYSTEIKLEIVKKYLEGRCGFKQPAHEYHIGSESDIQKWRKRFMYNNYERGKEASV